MPPCRQSIRGPMSFANGENLILIRRAKPARFHRNVGRAAALFGCMRRIARNWATPAIGYLSTVIGVIAIASLSVLTLQGMTAKAQRHWDADIDRIVAKQQAKKPGIVLASLARTDTTGSTSDVAPGIMTVTTGPASEDESRVRNGDTTKPKMQNQNGKKYNRRADKWRQHYVPAAFVTLPKFAATVATTTLLRPR
jgi:hypothetical protein